MNRREALRWLAAAAGTGWLEGLRSEDLIAWGRAVHADARQRDGGMPGGLGPHASRTVAAAAERIIPATDTPGATDARVGAFVDRMLADWHSPTERDRVLDGLGDLDARARRRHGRDFIACGEVDQLALLTGFDEEVAALRRTPPAGRPGTPANPDEHWFAMLKFLVVWGYCTSEVAQRETLGAWPMPGRYDACAPYPPATLRRGGS